MITLEQALSASGKYPERLKDPECTEEVRTNMTALLERVNALLTDLGVTNVTVSSGFRPAAVNAATKGSAKHSLHMSGNAIDLAGHEVYNLVMKHPELLKKHNLWMEASHSAPTWTHLDQGTRTDRPIRTFIA